MHLVFVLGMGADACALSLFCFWDLVDWKSIFIMGSMCSYVVQVYMYVLQTLADTDASTRYVYTCIQMPYAMRDSSRLSLVILMKNIHAYMVFASFVVGRYVSGGGVWFLYGVGTNYV